MSYTDGTPTVSYQYEANGERCWMYQGSSTAACGSPPSGASTYSYDSSGRLTSETNAAGATVTYGYDACSNLGCVSYPNSAGNTCSSTGTPSGVVRYSYNQTDQLTSLTDWGRRHPHLQLQRCRAAVLGLDLCAERAVVQLAAPPERRRNDRQLLRLLRRRLGHENDDWDLAD